MRRTLRKAALTAVLSIVGLLACGTPSARAQGLGLSFGSGYPGYGVSSYRSSITGYGNPGSFYSGYGYYGGAVPIYGYNYGGYLSAPAFGVYQTPYGNQAWYGHPLNAYPVSPSYGYQGNLYGPGFTIQGHPAWTPYNRFYP